ncbi:MAG: hypothetical protein R3C53_05110 [Pirellulaceae bacterium]
MSIQLLGGPESRWLLSSLMSLWMRDLSDAKTLRWAQLGTSCGTI